MQRNKDAFRNFEFIYVQLLYALLYFLKYTREKREILYKKRNERKKKRKKENRTKRNERKEEVMALTKIFPM